MSLDQSEIQSEIRNLQSEIQIAASVYLDDAPRLLVVVGGGGACGGQRERRLERLRQARQRVPVNLARDIVFGRRRRAAVQAHPDAEQRIAEAVALLARRDEIHV